MNCKRARNFLLKKLPPGTVPSLFTIFIWGVKMAFKMGSRLPRSLSESTTSFKYFSTIKSMKKCKMLKQLKKISLQLFTLILFSCENYKIIIKKNVLLVLFEKML